MKKTILMFAAAGLLLATPSCKKGENDPFMSLSSRKARVAGDWEITNLTQSTLNTESDGDWQSNETTYSGGTITNVYTDYDGTNQTSTTTTSTLNEGTYTFNKDGTYSAVWNTTSSSSFTLLGYTTVTTNVQTSTTTGNWSFLGKVKEGEETFKNKERIILNALVEMGTSQSTDVTTEDANPSNSVTTVNPLNAWTNNYSSGEVQMTWELDQLKGKEMIAVQTEMQSGNSSSTPNGGSTTTWTDDVYESTMTVTLSAVK